MTRQNEIEAALGKAGMTSRDGWIYSRMLKLAQWGTAEILPKFQPRSLVKLAEWCGVPLATLKRGLNHLEKHGWVERRRATPGRGHRTTYALHLGTACDCRPAPAGRAEPASDAERARRYRARKKAAHAAVTDPGTPRRKRLTYP